MILNNQFIEFFSYESDIYFKLNGDVIKLDESQGEVIRFLYTQIEQFYPDAVKALNKQYSFYNFDFKQKIYRMVLRFCKCNFGLADESKIDFTPDGFNLERVQCPLRGECPLENIVCNPKFNSKISDAELRVLKPFYEGEEIENIAEKLCLSPVTCKNHIANAYKRLGIHSKAEFTKYVIKNNLFR